MTRVPLLPSSALPPKYAEIYEEFVASYGPFRNQAAVLAHVPPALEHLSKLLMELKARAGLKARHLELAIVVTSKLNACRYCVSHHAPKLEVAGVSPAALAELPNWEHPEFDEFAIWPGTFRIESGEGEKQPRARAARAYASSK